MVITSEWLHRHGTTYNAWTRKQLESIGVQCGRGGSWLPKQWMHRMVGTTISDAQAREFERLGAERRRVLAKRVVADDKEWP